MNQPLEEVYTLLIPMAGCKMILPRTTVAEVMGYSDPKDRPDGAPDWLLGMIKWQDRQIPLVSFEKACGDEAPRAGSRTRVAVVYALGQRLRPPLIAIVTQGYPYLVRATNGIVKYDKEATESATGPILSWFRMANERPIIPDLEYFEDELGRVLGVTTETGEEEDTGLPSEDTDTGLDIFD